MIRPLSLIIVTCLCFDASAYEEDTHRHLSERAALKSVLAEPEARFRLGFPGALSTESTTLFPNSKDVARSIPELIQDGAEYEDADLRPLKHFFNPQPGNHYVLWSQILSASTIGFRRLYY